VDLGHGSDAAHGVTVAPIAAAKPAIPTEIVDAEGNGDEAVCIKTGC
jgi:hypothetical protein